MDDQERVIAHIDGLVQELARRRAALAQAAAALQDTLDSPEVQALQGQLAAKIDPLMEQKKDLAAKCETLRAELIAAAETSGIEKPHDALIPLTETDFEAVDDATLRAWLLAHMPGLLSLPSWNDYTIMRRAVYDSKRLSARFPTMPGSPFEKHTFNVKGDLTPWLVPVESFA